MSGVFSDPDGDALNYSVTTSNAGTVTAAITGSTATVVGVSTGIATVTVTATDPGGLVAQQSFSVTVPNRAPEVTDTIPELQLAAGDSATFDLEEYFRDPDGDALTYTPETSEEAIAAVSVSGTTLTVRAVARGRATVKVTVTDPGGLAADQSFGVVIPNQAPVVTDRILSQRLTAGETRTWAGPDYFADPDGDTLTYTAGTTDASIVLALVSGDEFGILAVTPGTATVTVTATDTDGLSASQSFQVTSEAQLPVIITDIEPVVLLEGGNATIRGSGFSSVPGNNVVLIDGLAATVTAASSTSLSVIVPHSDCLPPRKAELRVTVLGLGDARTVGVTPRTREDLDLPQYSYRYTLAGNGCLYLPGDVSGGEYLIGVVSTSEVPSSLTPVTMTSIPGDPAVAAAGVTAAARGEPSSELVAVAELSAADFSQVPALGLPGDVSPTSSGLGLASPTRDWERHNEIMAASEDLLLRLGPPSPPVVQARQSRTAAEGDTLTLFADPNPTCSAGSQIRALVRLTGENAVWLEDIENPSGTFTESELEELDAFYTTHVRGVHDGYYGDLSDVDGNGRIMILMTKAANREDDEGSFLGGWVWPVDLYSKSQCATSNEAEIFYGRVPDPGGVFGSAWTKQQTLEYYPSLLTHEITHLVQANARVFGGASLATWESEGGATLSEQLVAYRLFGHGSGQNLGYTAFQRGIDWYREWAVGMAKFFGWDSHDATGLGRVPRAPEQCSWIGRPEEGNGGPCRSPFRAVYDVPSMVFRYAMDRWGGTYPGGEGALMRRLSQSPEWGLASLATASEWRIEQILADFYVTLWMDLNGWESYGMTSWDLADIWSRFPENARLRPYVSTSAAFRGDWSIRAGSTFYLHWTPRSSRGPTSLRVTSLSGAPVPGHVSVWALRVR
ncbi:putative Ig domain-containing protein [Candidatus Palauibacter sp.]|uniref:IPT/TIG domain-containing protein n=1 Tax=Candidatus Palauibacter sp. TaxID=3101350 RepID=UPI003AF22131